MGNESLDEIRTHEVIGNTAQIVFNHLKSLESNRAHVLTRWVWELLQNARDASVGTDTGLVASIEQNEAEIVFRHNGSNFQIDEIVHLIYHGSTKIENTETIGQYGSGFLTTHLLSPEIGVSGQLDNGRSFDFQLKREVGGSVSELREAMDHAWSDFKNSLLYAPTTDNFTTMFRYPLRDDALEVVEEGIATLKQCAPFVVAFNQNFSSIDVKSPNESISFTVKERVSLGKDGLHQVTVSEIEGKTQRERKYLLAQGDKASVAIPLESLDGNLVCQPVGNTLRLFKGFPLIGTENFGFPAVINSLGFVPTDKRDGVYLGQGHDDANRDNQAIIEEACGLLVRILMFAASSGWHNAHVLADVPAIHEREWLNPGWLRSCLEERLVEKIRQNPVVLNEAGEVIPQDELKLPLSDTEEGVEALWDLLDGWQGASEGLPRRDEAAGWCEAAKSWANISGEEVSSFKEVTDGRKLAAQVQEASHDPSATLRTHRISRLNLKENVEVVTWLDRLIAFLNNNGLSDAIREYRIVPSQEGFLRTLPNLNRDCGIDDELKNIADLLDWRIRTALRDVGVTSLNDEPGAGDWDNDNVVEKLIKKLEERAAGKNPDDAFCEASVRLFAWIVGQKDYDSLRGFPAFAKELGSDELTVSYLPRPPQDSDCPLAPVRAWPEDLRQFSDIFPPTRILADAFYEEVPDLDAWQTLAEKSLVRTSVVMTNEVNIDRFYPDHPLSGDNVNHRTDNLVTVTDIVSRGAILDRVRDSRDRARLFWRFLTEWLTKEANESLVIKEDKCECGETHHYYPSAWLESLRETAWIRTRNDARALATAQSLADLLRGQWNPGSLNENPAAIKLLEAMGITRFDLLRAFTASSPEQGKEQDDILAGILVASGGSISYLNHARQYIEAVKIDEDIPNVLVKYQERKQRINENQSLGKLVEDLVKATLKYEKFTVRRKPIGSDFEIENDVVEKDEQVGTENEIGIEVTGNDQTWLVEVKATRSQADVGMTPTQAKTAVAQGSRFLLCVVPVVPGNVEPGLDEVRANMRFVQNIGPRVDRSCKDLAKLEGLRNQITTETPSNVQLRVDPVTARVSVNRSVWEDENDGFSIENLRNRLLNS